MIDTTIHGALVATSRHAERTEDIIGLAPFRK